MCAQILRNTPTYQMLMMIFGPKITTLDLISFANSVTCIDQRIIGLNRSEKRTKSLLIQWYNNNWYQIQPYFPYHDFLIQNYVQIQQNFLEDEFN